MTVGLILMTAIPPTKGHGHLIRWAKNYLDAHSPKTWNILYVMVGTQPSEPMVVERFQAIDKFCNSLGGNGRLTEVKAISFHKEVQQQPKGPDDHRFWADWKINIVNSIYEQRYFHDKNPENLILFSSEEYGAKLAEVLGCQHVPVDPNREILEVKGTTIRDNHLFHTDNILPEFLPYLQKTFTIFGAESTGKTTLAKQFVEDNKGISQFVHEWARPYLEYLPTPETTDERMEVIVNGQYAAQMAAKTTGKYLIVQDTDLLTTIGYYRIYSKGFEKLPGYKKCLELFSKTKSDHYFVLPSDIPFEVDPLRYGGTKRESVDDFWIDLLEEFKCNYTVVRDRHMARYYYLYKKYLETRSPIWDFKREGNK